MRVSPRALLLRQTDVYHMYHVLASKDHPQTLTSGSPGLTTPCQLISPKGRGKVAGSVTTAAETAEIAKAMIKAVERMLTRE